jgi:hypothetical protein
VLHSIVAAIYLLQAYYHLPQHHNCLLSFMGKKQISNIRSESEFRIFALLVRI